MINQITTPKENQTKSSMASAIRPFPFFFLFPLLIILSSFNAISSQSNSPDHPKPTPWPPQFHSLLFINLTTGHLQATDLWYDWPRGRNFNIIQKQLGKLLYDLEWDNGTSFYYTLDSNRECNVMKFSVGILHPNWLDNATYLGQRKVDGFLCNVWEKVDFIWYYEDVVTKRPVQWIFYTGLTTHVMTFEVGAVLEDEQWQAPVYCFGEGKKENRIEYVVAVGSSSGLKMMNSV